MVNSINELFKIQYFIFSRTMFFTLNRLYSWSRQENWLNNLGILSLWIILFVAACLRFYQLGEESLWGDELASIRDIKRVAEGELFVNRIFYFLIMRFWMLFETNEFWLRLPSVVFGILSVFLVYRLGIKLFDKKVGLIAALLLALSPLAIFHSQEVRMYMLSVLLGLGGTLAIVYYVINRQLKFIFLWVSLRILAILTTPINILLAIPDIIILGFNIFSRMGLKYRPRQTLIFTLSGLFIGALFLLVFYPSLKLLIDFVQVKQIPWDMDLTFVSFIGGIARLTIWSLESPIPDWSWFYDHFFNVYGIGLVALLIVSFFANYSTSHKIWMILWGLLTLIVLFFGCKWIAPMLWGIPRYSLFLSPYLFILLALGIVQLWKWQQKIAVVLITIYFFAVSSSLWHYYNTDTDEDWRSVFQTVNTYEEPNDALVLYPAYSKLASDYYYQGNSPIYLVKNRGSYPTESDINAIFNDVYEDAKFKSLASTKSRIWFILNYTNQGLSKEDEQIFVRNVKEEFPVISQFQFAGVEIIVVNTD